MMRLNPLNIIRVFLIAVLIIFLSLLLITKIYVPREISKAVSEFSKEKGVDLEIGNISFDLFKGLTGKDINLADNKNEKNSSIKLEKIKIKPKLYASYSEKRLIVKELKLSGSKIEIAKDFSGFIKNLVESEGESEEKQSLVVEKINVEKMQILSNDGMNINFDNLIFDAKESTDDEKKVLIYGVLATGNQSNDNIRFDGKVNLKADEKIGNLLLNFPLNKELKSSITSDFDYKDNISLSGNISVDATEGEGNFAVADWNSKFDKESDSIELNITNFNVLNILRLKLSGLIEGVNKNLDTALVGGLEIDDLQSFSSFIPQLQTYGLAGDLKAEKLNIKGPLKDFTYQNLLVDGTFKSENFLSKFANLTKASGNFEIRNVDGDDLIRFKNINSKLNGGNVKGSAEININKNLINSTIKANNLAFNDNSPAIFNLPIFGKVENLEAKIDGPIDNLDIDLLIDSSKFGLDLNQNKVNFSNLKSNKKLNANLKKLNDSYSYLFNGESFDFKDFSYLGFESQKGEIRDLEFNYKNKEDWELNLNSTGELVSNSTLKAELSNYKLKINAGNKNGIRVIGNIEGEAGDYREKALEEFQTNFDYRKNLIEFYSLNAELTGYGLLETEKAKISFPKNSNRNYLLEFDNGTFTYLNSEIISEGIKGNLKIKPDSTLRGKIYSDSATIYNNKISDIQFNFDTNSGAYNFSDINSKIFNGKLTGKLKLDFSNGATNFNTKLKLNGISNRMKDNNVNFGDISINAEGGIKDGLFENLAANIEILGLTIGEDGLESTVDGSADFSADPETIYVKNGFITSRKGEKLRFNGEIYNYFGEKRSSRFKVPSVPLKFFTDFVDPFLPFGFIFNKVNGTASLDFNTFNLAKSINNWDGNIELNGVSFKGIYSQTDFLVDDLEGLITIKNVSKKEDTLINILGDDLEINREVYKKFLKKLKNVDNKTNGNYLKINRFKYGFIEAEDIETVFEIDKEKMNLQYFKSDIYGGKLFGNGFLKYGGKDERYNFTLLSNNLSLKKISDSLPSMKDYITGLVDGVLWFSLGDGYWTINGPFSFWAKDSKDEKRKIGKALLKKIGGKGKIFLRSSRRYDKGKISGYIKDGFMTFKQFEISNSMLGYKDLTIKADEKMNSISVKHLLSVIRELARRASQGGIEIEFEDKNKEEK